jgi:hypothetical protein
VKQFVPLSCSGSKRGIDYCSLAFGPEFHGFVDSRMLSSVEEEELIQTESQDITETSFESGRAQAADPKIEQG